MDEITDDINVDNFELKPGPKDTYVLHLQAEHRSSTIWNLGGGNLLRARVRNPSSNRFPSLHPRMVPLFKDVGFDGVARLTGIHTDWSLVTALVEHWRPETHTFHLPVGEYTITLQDVSIIPGLRVDGRAVSGCTEFKGGWSNLIESVFGKAPGKHNLDGGRLRLNWLAKLFTALSDDANEDELIQYTQSYMLQLIGGILFTDIKDRKFILWAWTRLPTLAPIPRGSYVDNREIWGDTPGPFGLRWCAPKSYVDSSSHVVYIDRLSLDVLLPDHFVWMPYADLLNKLSNICQEGKTKIDWRDKHKDHILLWNNRLQSIILIGNRGLGITDGYADWYANITRPYHTRVAAAQSHVFNILNRISSIATGAVSGDYNTIDVLSKHGRRVLKSQYSRGLRQDFPTDDSFVSTGHVEVKMKKKGHKEGRGGVNAPKRRKLRNDDERCDHINEDTSIHLSQTATSIEHGMEDHQVKIRGIDPSPVCGIPSST
ncbi:hypothetical protein AgCh_029429 [Apium graveolens]